MRSAVLHVARAARDVARGLMDLWMPPVCPACQADDVSADAAGGLCEDCNIRLLALVALQYCPRCGSTVGPNIPLYEDGCAWCPAPSPRWDRVVRLGPYSPPLRTAVRQLKYHRREIIPLRLAKMLAQAIATHLPDAAFDVAVPIPPHWRRRLARGCDHTAMLAAGLARQLRLPVGKELLRVRNTPPQVWLPKSRREKNIRGAFRAVSDSALAGAHVLLIDDVTTTGGTANEATRVLLAAGASRVDLAVIAKAEPPTAYAPYKLT